MAPSLRKKPRLYGSESSGDAIQDKALRLNASKFLAVAPGRSLGCHYMQNGLKTIKRRYLTPFLAFNVRDSDDYKLYKYVSSQIYRYSRRRL